MIQHPVVVSLALAKQALISMRITIASYEMWGYQDRFPDILRDLHLAAIELEDVIKKGER